MKPMIHLGESASVTRTFSENDVAFFSQVSGDCNPLHLNEAYAQTTVFKSRVVHGALLNALFSSLLGNELPGEGAIYCKQESSFIKPVYIGEEIHASVIIKDIIESKNRIVFDTIAKNNKGETVVKGEATVLYPHLGKDAS